MEGDRRFVGIDNDSQVENRHTGDDIANAILELDPNDVPWTDVLGDIEDPPDVGIAESKGEERLLRLAFE